MNRLMPVSLLIPGTLLLTGLTGCTAIRSTVHLAQAEQAYRVAVAADAETWAPYSHARAQSLLLKAREEWGYSDFGPAEELFDQSKEWSVKARAEADQADRTQPPPGTQAPGLMAPGSATPPTPEAAQ